MKRLFVSCLWLLCLCPSSWAQLEPGQHSFTPILGVTFPTNDLLHATAPQPTPRPPFTPNDVVADIGIDPGFLSGIRYSYNLSRRLMLEAEANLSLSVFFIQLLEIMPDAEPGEPQFETTTTDARVSHLFLNLSYVFGPWSLVDPFLTVGIGSQRMDLRQRGEVNFDTIHDRAFMAGMGLFFHAHPRLKIRVELRDYMYNFSFDNQFVDERASQIVFRRPEFGRITAAAGPRFQNDLALNIGFQVQPF